jgi:hypothetical protein
VDDCRGGITKSMADEAPRIDQVVPEGRPGRSIAISRRTLLRAGWSVPVILTVAPAVAFAASGPTSRSATPGGSNFPSQPTSSSSGSPNSGSQSAPGGDGDSNAPSGLPEQQSGAPQPARIERGFTG